MLVALGDVGGTLMDVVPNYTHSSEAWDCGNPCPLVWSGRPCCRRPQELQSAFFKGHSRGVRQSVYVLAPHIICEGILGPWGRLYMIYKEDCVLNLTTTQG